MRANWHERYVVPAADGRWAPEIDLASEIRLICVLVPVARFRKRALERMFRSVITDVVAAVVGSHPAA